jgi:hypothetical protein
MALLSYELGRCRRGLDPVDCLVVAGTQVVAKAAQITSAIPGNHRRLGLQRCGPKVEVLWSRSVSRGQI